MLSSNKIEEKLLNTIINGIERKGGNMKDINNEPTLTVALRNNLS